jgi:hypothetical protein
MTASSIVAPLLGITYQLRGAFAKFSIDQIRPPPIRVQTHPTLPIHSQTHPPAHSCPNSNLEQWLTPQNRRAPLSSAPCHHPLSRFAPFWSNASLHPLGLTTVFIPLASRLSSSPRPPHQSIRPCWELDDHNTGYFVQPSSSFFLLLFRPSKPVFPLFMCHHVQCLARPPSMHTKPNLRILGKP